MYNLVIDAGNTFVKAALYEHYHEVHAFQWKEVNSIAESLENFPIKNLIFSSVGFYDEHILDSVVFSGKKIILNHNTAIPLTNKYQTPSTLGLDRLAAAVGAHYMSEGVPVLVVDAGTCLTYDIVDKEGNYLGGAISPGLTMRFQAMHTFTQKLPFIKHTNEDVPMLGTHTNACLKSGAIIGMCKEIEGMIDGYRQLFPGITVYSCGGDAIFFESRIKQPIFVTPGLVLHGLNRILLHNV